GEGAGARDFAGEGPVVEDQPQLLVLDEGMVEVDGAAHPEVRRWGDASELVSLANLEGLAHDEEALELALQLEPGRAQQVDERRRAPIHDGNLGPVNLDAQVVDPQAGNRSQQMLD